MGDNGTRVTHLHLEVHLDAVTGEPADELARILRYWAGNLKHYDLGTPQSEIIRDSAYREVGRWSLS